MRLARIQLNMFRLLSKKAALEKVPRQGERNYLRPDGIGSGSSVARPRREWASRDQVTVVTPVGLV